MSILSEQTETSHRGNILPYSDQASYKEHRCKTSTKLF